MTEIGVLVIEVCVLRSRKSAFKNCQSISTTTVLTVAKTVSHVLFLANFKLIFFPDAWSYEALFWKECRKTVWSVIHSTTTERSLVNWRNMGYIPLNTTDRNYHSRIIKFNGSSDACMFVLIFCRILFLVTLHFEANTVSRSGASLSYKNLKNSWLARDVIIF